MTLNRIRFVLVRPTHPGNVGSTARAMKNMALQNLYLVAPGGLPNREASMRAAGAEDILTGARICATLDEAVHDCHTVVGTSARARRIGWPVLDPRAAAEQLVLAARLGPVAVVFGQERTGLTNAELDCCHAVVRIPTNEAYPSLNIACAAQILAYEILCAGLKEHVPSVPERVPVSHGEMRRFFQHLHAVLVHVGFLDPAQPRLLMRRLIRLFNRARPDQNEINILRGMLTAIQQRDRTLDKDSAQ